MIDLRHELLLRGVLAVGRRRAQRLVRDGLPERLGAPLLSALEGSADAESAGVVRQVEAIRSELAASGARWVAEVDSVTPFWGALLYRLASAGRARTILELGSCAGISGCYLALSRECRRFVTVEGTSALAQVAAANLRRAAPHAEVIHATFDDALDRLLPVESGDLDLIFIDGSKGLRDNLRWIERVLPHLDDGGLLVLDDIHYSAEMEAVWKTLCGRPGFSHAVDGGRFGVWLRHRAATAPKAYKLFQVAGVDLPALFRGVRLS